LTKNVLNAYFFLKHIGKPAAADTTTLAEIPNRGTCGNFGALTLEEKKV
jgi:hypothetical protein